MYGFLNANGWNQKWFSLPKIETGLESQEHVYEWYLFLHMLEQKNRPKSTC